MTIWASRLRPLSSPSPSVAPMFRLFVRRLSAAGSRQDGGDLWRNTRVSADHTHHIWRDGRGAVYDARFQAVLPFHEPGLAPVDSTSEGAYHIKMDGTPAYNARFSRTFGFYEGRSTVVMPDGNRWIHINPSGEPAYGLAKSWHWAGNFQQGFCAVRDFNLKYFHIDYNGDHLNSSGFAYAGDFREGHAVVRLNNGFCTHIAEDGHLADYGFELVDLDVFHKGFARARDREGWFHVDQHGQDRSRGRRYADLEPFYNGQARATLRPGHCVIVNEEGETMCSLPGPESVLMDELQHDTVAYWQSFALALGLKQLLPELVQNRQDDAVSAEEGSDGLKALMAAWQDLGLVKDGKLTAKGRLLCDPETQNKIVYWTSVQLYPWLDALVVNRSSQAPPKESFFHRPRDPSEYQLIHEVLHSYSKDDYENVAKALSEVLQLDDEIVVDIAGGRGFLLKRLLDAAPNLAGILVDLEPALAGAEEHSRMTHQQSDMFRDELPSGNVYLLSRVLHDWSDDACVGLLRRIHAASQRTPGSCIPRLVVIERMADTDADQLHGLLSLNMHLTTGGKERRLQEFEELFAQSGWQLMLNHRVMPSSSGLHALVCQPTGCN